MKKVLALLLALSLVFALCACGGEAEEKKEEESKKNPAIKLTSYTVPDYLAFNVTPKDVKDESYVDYFNRYQNAASSTLELKLYPTQAGSFSQVKITAEITLQKGWRVDSSDPGYSEDNENVLTVNIVLPASGEYTETHKIVAGGDLEPAFDDPIGSNFKVKIVSVEGTFTKS